MADWLEFEEKCTAYLNKNFGHKATFRHMGGADSTVPDIHVVTKTGKKFYMDAKMTPSACGQFVLQPIVSTSTFVFSENNKTGISPEVQAIIRHMNQDFEAYKEAGTAGKDINLGDDGKTFFRWIIATYLQKGAEFFITNDFTILPTRDLPKHFTVTAKYRTKRSGSRPAGVKAAPLVYQYILTQNFSVYDRRIAKDKLYVYSTDQIHNKRFVYDGYEYMFSARGERYEVRKLSNTFNANVIFSICKNNRAGLTAAEFERSLD